jgi:hypothetical protein
MGLQEASFLFRKVAEGSSGGAGEAQWVKEKPIHQRNTYFFSGIFPRSFMRREQPDREQWKPYERAFRGWLYRRIPAGNHLLGQKRRAGYERRWGLETQGYTKRGFFKILQRRLLGDVPSGRWLELQVGDGLVGSLGVWLETIAQERGWIFEAWEHRAWPAVSFRKNRPLTVLHVGRLTSWTDTNVAGRPVGITTRGVREAAGVCRAIRNGRIRPTLLGLWNPKRRWLWEVRLRACGYRLELIYDRMEFYKDQGK